MGEFGCTSTYSGRFDPMPSKKGSKEMKPRREFTGRSNIADRQRSKNRRPLGQRIRSGSSYRSARGRLRLILVPVDFSTQSLRALGHAVDRARESGAAIILLHVLEPLYPLGHAEAARLRSLKAEARRDFKQRLKTLAALRIPSDIPFKAWLVDGDPAEVIVHTAAKTASDLIVMGSVGRKGIRRLLLGSVAEQVARNADVPVTVVRNPRKAKKPAPDELN
jgi:nucleotide-binding universal stress UspA family protein